MNYVVIDLDSLAYIVAYHQYVTLENKVDTQKVSEHVEDFIKSILQATKADKYILFFQGAGSRVFRYDFYKAYKLNRPKEAPDFLKCWKLTIRGEFHRLGAIPLYNIEVDDALAIIHKQFISTEDTLVLAHNDKDMFQLSGEHYLYKTLESIYVNPIDAEFNLYKQLLTGDSTDNIIGCGNLVIQKYKTGKNAGKVYQARKGIGPKAAEELLKTSDNYEKTVIEEYNKLHGEYGQNTYEFNRQLIELLDPDQQYEQFDINWKTNTELQDLSSLFNVE